MTGGLAPQSSRGGELHYVDFALAAESRPLGLDLDRTDFSHRVVTETAPWPVFRSGHQTANNGVAVNVLQLLDALAPSADIEVIEAALPELPRGSVFQILPFYFCGCPILSLSLGKGGIENLSSLVRNPLFEDLKNDTDIFPFRF